MFGLRRLTTDIVQIGYPIRNGGSARQEAHALGRAFVLTAPPFTRRAGTVCYP